MTKIEIKLEYGKWLINGKTYQQLDYLEKEFFDEFLVAMRINFGAEQAAKC